MKQAFFVAGTDTDVGKTLISAALLCGAQQRGLTTLGLKPVAAGCARGPEGLRHADAQLLASVSSVSLPYQQINPVALEPAIAPHIAAQEAELTLSVQRLSGYCRGALGQADLTLVEGAGGWRVPLNRRETLADLPRQLNLPVVLVVGLRLGCLSHALLTSEAIARDGLRLAAWVANTLDPHMPRLEQNIEALVERLPAPMLGVVPHLSQPTPEAAAEYLDLTLLGCA